MEKTKKLFAGIFNFWAKWPVVRKGILLVLVTGVILGIIVLFNVLPSSEMVAVIDASIKDEYVLDRIKRRINQEGVKVFITSTGLVQVKDESTARRMRTILIKEDLIPSDVDPWKIFDKER